MTNGPGCLPGVLPMQRLKVADAVSEVDQSYSWGRITAHCASTAGSDFNDVEDFCDTAVEGNQGTAGTGQCVAICAAPVGGED